MSDDPENGPQDQPQGSGDADDGSAGSLVALPLAERPTVLSGHRPTGSSPGKGLLDPDSLVRGERLDHFELQEYIGVGGMGTVFRAWDTRLQRAVALKVLPREQAADGETAQRFIHEAQAAARLNHENIARVYFVGQARGLHYIAFEFVEGIDVRKLIAQLGRLPVNDVVSNALQLASALKHAAERDVVHRDIKPSNIVVTPEGLAKLVDMGLARNYDTHGGLTASGVTLGTFDYLSPEQAHDPRTADVRSDIYSLGCTLYHMLTARVPFPDGNALQKMLQHREQQPVDPRQFNPEIPDELAAIVLRMMRKRPKDRFQSPSELLHSLTLLAGSLGLHATSPEGLIWMAPGSVPVPAWQRHAVWMIPVLGVLILVGVVGIYTQQGGERGFAPLARGPEPAQSLEQTRGASGPVSTAQKSANSGKAEGGVPATGTGSVTAASNDDPSNPPAGKEREQVDTSENPNGAESKSGVGNTAPSPNEGMSGNAATAVSSPPQGELRLGSSDVKGAAQVKVVAVPGDTRRRSGPPDDLPTTPQVERRESSTPDAEPVPARPAASGTLVVDPNAKEGAFKTLKAAVAESMQGAGTVIELRFDGTLQEGPIRISGLKRLTVRAGDGFHPTVLFDASQVPTGEQARLLNFVDGTLDLIGLNLVLDAPAGGTAQDLALVSVRDAQRLHLQNCMLTIRNPEGRSATFVESRSSSDEDALGMNVPPAQDRSELEIESCFLRGDGDAIALRQPKNVRIALGDDNVIATNQRLMIVESDRMHNPSVELEITHVTARADRGLLLVDAAAGAKPRIKIRAEDNILMLNGDYPLISQRGELAVADFRDSFQWEGHSNFYQGVETFWAIESTNPPEMALEPRSDSFDAEDWQSFWGIDQESAPRIGTLQWKKSDALVPTWELESSHFALSDEESNAKGGASDGKDAGANLLRIPQQSKTSVNKP